jgi:hypothetical protein
MASNNSPHSVALSVVGTSIGASVSNVEVSKQFRISPSGSRSIRVDLLVGKVAIANGITAKLQHSSGYNLWSDANTVAVTASTEKTISAVDDATDILTSVAHGYVTGQPVVINSSTAVPRGLSAGEIYFVLKINDDTFYLVDAPDSEKPIDLLSAGSGTITTTAVRCLSITQQEVVTADQSVMPLKPLGRIVCSSGASDSAQIVDILVVQS